MKILDSVKKVKIKASPVHYVTGVAFVALIAVTLYFTFKKGNETILLENGMIEKTTIATSYVIKNETIVEKDLNKVLVPVIAEGSKTKKDGIIAIYKGEEYMDYEATLAKLDGEILELMKDLPAVYSSEVEAIDSTIYEIVKDSINETSYAKMQEYKQRINTQINKRASIIGDLSPDGAEIKKLIDKRNKYEEQAKNSNDNLLAPASGIVSYKTDGFEEKFLISKIDKLNYSDVNDMVQTTNIVDNTKIKIVNNYEAYILTKVPKEDKDYIKNNTNYKLRLLESNNYEIKGKLVKVEETAGGIELCFKITNGIEHLVDLREIEVEIIWWQSSGLVINNEALVKYNNKDAYCIYAVKYSEIVDIPVRIKKQNDNYSVIENYDYEQLTDLGLETKYKIKLHDRVIIK